MRTRSRSLLHCACAVSALLAAPTIVLADGAPDPTFFGDGLYAVGAAPDTLFVRSIVPSRDGSSLFWAGTRNTAAAPGLHARLAVVSDTAALGHFDLVLANGAATLFETLTIDGSGRAVGGGVAYLTNGSSRLLLVRFLANSLDLDPSFDSDGVLMLDLGVPAGSDQTVFALAPDGDDIIVLAAGSFNPQNTGDRTFMVARLLPSGELDAGFGAGGWAELEPPGPSLFMTLAVHPGGRIYVGGDGRSANGTNQDFLLYALDPSGTPDADFGTGGLLHVTFGASSDEYSTDMALLSDGRVVMSGLHFRDIEPSQVGAVAMIRPDGTFDEGFGLGGRLVSPFFDLFNAVQPQGDGRLLLSAHTWAPNDGIRILRTSPDGTWDPTWDADAAFLPFAEGSYDAPRDLVLHGGRVVVAASLLNELPDSSLVGLARLQNSYVFADGFELGSTASWSTP